MVAPHSTSPNVGNYVVGRGIGYAKLVPPSYTSDPDYIDLGNITEFTFQVKPTRLDHYSSRIGVRKKDLVVVTELAATLTVVLEEFTARNLAFALLGVPANSPPGTSTISILTEPLVYAAFKFVSTNIVGPQWTYEFPLTLFTPSKAINLLPAGAGTWGSFDFECDVLFDDISGGFGTAQATGIESP
jgi:hypothetical protein